MAIDYKFCKMCKRMLPVSYKGEYCGDCEDLLLFDRVRDFVRSHEVNEYQLAEYFDIPLRQVKQWIREGRMEYKERSQKNLMHSYCVHCGARVDFGSLCPKCLKLLNGSPKGYGLVLSKEEESKMRFIEKEE